MQVQIVRLGPLLSFPQKTDRFSLDSDYTVLTPSNKSLLENLENKRKTNSSLRMNSPHYEPSYLKREEPLSYAKDVSVIYLRDHYSTASKENMLTSFSHLLDAKNKEIETLRYQLSMSRAPVMGSQTEYMLRKELETLRAENRQLRAEREDAIHKLRMHQIRTTVEPVESAMKSFTFNVEEKERIKAKDRKIEELMDALEHRERQIKVNSSGNSVETR